MKYLFSLLALVIFSQLNYAQSALNSVTSHVCECLEKNPDSYKDQVSLQVTMQNCAMSADQVELMNMLVELEISDPTNPQQMLKLSEALSNDLEANCESFSQGIESIKVKMIEEQTQNVLSGQSTTQTTSSFMQVEGVIVDRFFDSITSYTLHDLDKNLVKIYWLGPFSGSKALEENPNLFLDKHVVIDYEEAQIYDPKMFAYRKVKILKGIRAAEQ